MSVKEAVLMGEYQLVLFTPEMFLEQKRWRKMLLGDVYSSRLQAFVVDEAHTVKKWLGYLIYMVAKLLTLGAHAQRGL